MWRRQQYNEDDEVANTPPRQGWMGRLLLNSPGENYGSMGDESESETELTDFDTEGHGMAIDDYTAYEEEDHEDDEPGVIEVKIVRAAELPPGSVIEGRDAQVQVIQGPNLRLLKEFISQAPPPLIIEEEKTSGGIDHVFARLANIGGSRSDLSSMNANAGKNDMSAANNSSSSSNNNNNNNNNTGLSNSGANGSSNGNPHSSIEMGGRGESNGYANHFGDQTLGVADLMPPHIGLELRDNKPVPGDGDAHDEIALGMDAQTHAAALAEREQAVIQMRAMTTSSPRGGGGDGGTKGVGMGGGGVSPMPVRKPEPEYPAHRASSPIPPHRERVRSRGSGGSFMSGSGASFGPQSAHRRPSGEPHDPLTPGGMEHHFATLHALNHHHTGGANGGGGGGGTAAASAAANGSHHGPIPYDNTHRHGSVNSYGTPEPLYNGISDQPRPVVDVKVTESLPKDGTQVIWDQAFVFDMLRKPDNILKGDGMVMGGEGEAQTLEEQQQQAMREDEERELLGIINDSGQLGQRSLLSLADGTPIDLDRDAVLDADATLLLRVFDDHPESEGSNLIGQALVVIPSMAMLAGAEQLMAWHELHSKDHTNIGRLQVGLRFGLYPEPNDVDEDEDVDALMEVDLLSRKLFLRYDKNADGYLTRREFHAFVKELINVGGNIKTLEDTGDGGCLGYCIPLPTLDLFSFIKHRHTLLVVCFDRSQKQIVSTTCERMGVVLMSLLWSLSSNCLVEVYMHSSRFWQVLVITSVDTFGTSALAGIFLVSHWTHCRRCWLHCTHLPLVVFIIFLGTLSGWLLVAMSPNQLYSSGYSFFPIWAFARFTEIFKLGTYWAFMVQYGSSQQARKTRKERARREKEAKLERRRRERLLWERTHAAAPWWRFQWLRHPGADPALW